VASNNTSSAVLLDAKGHDIYIEIVVFCEVIDFIDSNGVGFTLPEKITQMELAAITNSVV
jgi:hypothetical protein